MTDLPYVEHHIQKHILSCLMTRQFARFRDMRPAQTDTNLYSYHLKVLMRQGFVEKTEQGYALSMRGQVYVDRVNLATTKRTLQPKVITMLVIQDGYGNVLMYPKKRQPFIDQWTVPLGKVHNSDASLSQAAQREITEKISQDVNIDVRHAGDAYIRIKQGDDVFISTLVHVFYGRVDELNDLDEHLKWVSLRSLETMDVAPAVTHIISRTLFGDPFFFEEYTEELV